MCRSCNRNTDFAASLSLPTALPRVKVWPTPRIDISWRSNIVQGFDSEHITIVQDLPEIPELQGGPPARLSLHCC